MKNKISKIRFLESLQPTNEAAEAIVELKRDYRKELKRQTINSTFEQWRERWHYAEEDDYRWRVVVLEADRTDYSEAFRRGTSIKAYIAEWLWNTQAKTVNPCYDCTGQWFTTTFQVAHIADNRFLVREAQRLDV